MVGSKRCFLTRLESSDQGTFGRIVSGEFVLFAGELPWRDNRPNESSIPPGLYRCAWTWSPRFQRFVYMVLNVPGRAGVRFHAANLMGDASKGLRSQLNGCIALGERLGAIDGQKAILLSAPALRRFEFALGRQPFELEIHNG